MRAVGRSLCRSVAIIIKGIDIFLLSCAPGGVPFPRAISPGAGKTEENGANVRILMFEGREGKRRRGQIVQSQENLISQLEKAKIHHCLPMMLLLLCNICYYTLVFYSLKCILTPAIPRQT